ncbi:MAG: EAL domain-containing protein [Lachnospiraceae bacterium]|nr:EAL domain-containing protein [Ruminococcus sp.]MCM1274180.1 EAL domain-containing protein [Lachnospiraceae bacterium]
MDFYIIVLRARRGRQLAAFLVRISAPRRVNDFSQEVSVMTGLEQAVSNSGSFAFAMKYQPDFPIEFLLGDNPFSNEKTALLGEIICPEDYQPFCDIIGEVISGHQSGVKAHVRLKCGDAYRWYYIAAAPEFREDGTLRVLSGMLFDVTEYLDCEGSDEVMRHFKSKAAGSMGSSSDNMPRLLDILGQDYLERIQLPFSRIKGMYSAIVGEDGKILAAAQDKKINLNKMSYQRKKSIRVKHRAIASWVIAGESPEDINDCVPLLETMVQTVSEIANSYVVICEEMENSQKANKLLGQNFEDQILVNNIYSVILQSRSNAASFGSIIPLIRDYFSLDDMFFCTDNVRPIKVYRWSETGDIIPTVSTTPFIERVDKELENNSVVCMTEDELRGEESKGRSVAMSRVYENGSPRGLIVFMSHDGDRVWTNRDRKMIRNVTQIISTVIYRSFTENELAVSQEHLLRLAYYNTTTGIPNRSAFERDFGKSIAEGGGGAVISVEISNLKELSEAYTTRYSEDIVRGVAEYIAAIPSENPKTVYMFSSDTLFVMMNGSSREEALVIAQNILTKFRSPWFLNDSEKQLDIYAGICVYPNDADSVADCVRVATRTLRLAKDRRLHDALSYSDGLEEKLDNNLRVKKLVMEAAENDFKGFYFLYTPVVDAKTEELQCCEAHLFWSNGDIIVSRDRFLPVVERIGLAEEIYAFVIERICEFCANVRESGLSHFRVSFSIPENILNSETGVMVLRKGLLEYSLPPEAISISVSESDGTLGMRNNFLRQMANSGVNIIADDKGGNFFTAAPLENPYVRCIKLRSRRLSGDPVSAAFVRSVIERAHEKGITVCVKGVDSPAALETARGFDADMIQGIVNGRPLRSSEFIKKMVVNNAVK